MFDANSTEVIVASVAGSFSSLLTLIAYSYDHYVKVNVVYTGFVSGAILLTSSIFFFMTIPRKTGLISK